jgi:signal peptidase I
MPSALPKLGPGPVTNLGVWLGLSSVVDYPSLKKNGFAVAARNVRLQGQLSDDFEGDLTLTQEVMGQTLMQERVRDIKNKRFDIKVHLMRGRNIFHFTPATGTGPQFRLDLFYRSTVREWVESIIKALVLVLVVKTFAVQAFFIPTESMQKTLLVGDYLLVDKISYLFRDPRPGEIIVFEFPNDPTKDFIKRVVAVAGDTISHNNNQLVINGKAMKELYTQYLPIPDLRMETDRRSFGSKTIEPHHYFMMGDNRNNSQDSRWWGPLPSWRLIGRAWACYYPFTRIGLISHKFGTPE